MGVLTNSEGATAVQLAEKLGVEMEPGTKSWLECEFGPAIYAQENALEQLEALSMKSDYTLSTSTGLISLTRFDYSNTQQPITIDNHGQLSNIFYTADFMLRWNPPTISLNIPIKTSNSYFSGISIFPEYDSQELSIRIGRNSVVYDEQGNLKWFTFNIGRELSNPIREAPDCGVSIPGPTYKSVQPIVSYMDTRHNHVSIPLKYRKTISSFPGSMDDNYKIHLSVPVTNEERTTFQIRVGKPKNQHTINANVLNKIGFRKSDLVISSLPPIGGRTTEEEYLEKNSQIITNQELIERLDGIVKNAKDLVI